MADPDCSKIRDGKKLCTTEGRKNNKYAFDGKTANNTNCEVE